MRSPGVFLIKYRVEYLLAFPLIVLLFAHDLAPSVCSGSVPQEPEKLLDEKRLMVISWAMMITLVILSFVYINFLHDFSAPHFLKIERFLITPVG